MNKLHTVFLLVVCALPAVGRAATTSGFDSTTPELPIAVQGNAIIDLVPTGATLNGNLTVTSTVSAQGEIKVGEDGTGCGNPTAGTVRFDYGAHVLQYCDGSTWQGVSNAAPAGAMCGWSMYGGGNSLATGSTACQGMNPINGCPDSYHQGTATYQDSTGGNFTALFCVKS